MGRWSREVAPLFVAWLDLPPGRRWLDLGCGTGALSSSVLAGAGPQRVLGVDPSPDFVAWAEAHTTDPRARFEVGDASTLRPESADVAVSGLVLNFLTDPVAGVRAMAAAARGGAVGAYVWDYAGGMQLLHEFWEAAVGLDAAAAPLHEATRFRGWGPERLEDLWRAAGLVDVVSTTLEARRTVDDFDEVWGPFLGGAGPAPAYVAGLGEDERAELAAAFRARLAHSDDGSITLLARAYAVRGRG